jgi:hypothetical protein
VDDRAEQIEVDTVEGMEEPCGFSLQCSGEEIGYDVFLWFVRMHVLVTSGT